MKLCRTRFIFYTDLPRVSATVGGEYKKYDKKLFSLLNSFAIRILNDFPGLQ
jgi:hypothetical protein